MFNLCIEYIICCKLVYFYGHFGKVLFVHKKPHGYVLQHLQSLLADVVTLISTLVRTIVYVFVLIFFGYLYLNVL